MKNISEQLRRYIALTLCLIVITPSFAFAFSKSTLQSISDGTYFYDASATSCISPESGSTAAPSQSQIQNAQTVIGIAKTENLGQAGALIGLMVGLAESGLQNHANTKMPNSMSIPHEGEGSDYDSVGIYQQRISTGWSTLATGDNAAAKTQDGSQNYSNGFPDAIAQIMTPAYSAEAFFGSPAGSNAPSALSKGLQNHSDWQKVEPWVAAQEVQHSGDSTGSEYKAKLAAAQELIGKYWDSSPAIDLPLAFSAPAASGSGSNSSGSSGGCLTSLASGDEQQLAQQILDNKNITFDYGPSGIVAQPFHELAAGQKASTAIAGQPTDVSSTLLGFILDIASSHKVNVSSLTTEHKAGDVHSTGLAVDINILDGKHITGRDDLSHTIVDVALQALPKGTRFGQVSCPGASLNLPSGYSEFQDSCTHLHIDVPKGTP